MLVGNGSVQPIWVLPLVQTVLPDQQIALLVTVRPALPLAVAVWPVNRLAVIETGVVDEVCVRAAYFVSVDVAFHAVMLASQMPYNACAPVA